MADVLSSVEVFSVLSVVGMTNVLSSVKMFSVDMVSVLCRNGHCVIQVLPDI